jgi:hypothetical protein
MLSPMAKGIQALHSTVELFNNYVPNPSNDDTVNTEPYDMLYDWSLNHKTCISLNAGTSPDLEELSFFLATKYNPYPWSTFSEDESLGKLMTSISIVLPEKIYACSEIFRKYRDAFFSEDGYIVHNEIISGLQYRITITKYGEYTPYEQALSQKMNEYRLASV